MNLVEMRGRQGSAFNFNELYVKGINIFDLAKNAVAVGDEGSPVYVNITTAYTADTVGLGYSRGDLLYSTEFIFTELSPVQKKTLWYNATQNTRLPAPPNTQYLTLMSGVSNTGATQTAVFTGTNGSSPGTRGLVPAPSAFDKDKFLRADGTWASISNSLNAIDAATLAGVRKDVNQAQAVLTGLASTKADKADTFTKAETAALVENSFIVQPVTDGGSF